MTGKGVGTASIAANEGVVATGGVAEASTETSKKVEGSGGVGTTSTSTKEDVVAAGGVAPASKAAPPRLPSSHCRREPRLLEVLSRIGPTVGSERSG